MFRNDGIRVLISRGAAAEQAERLRAGVPEFVALPGENGDGITHPHVTDLALDPDSAVPCVI